jgi:hypothetical protein
MKGEKVVTNLVPYGPEKPRSGMVRLASTNQVTHKLISNKPEALYSKI